MVRHNDIILKHIGKNTSDSFPINIQEHYLYFIFFVYREPYLSLKNSAWFDTVLICLIVALRYFFVYKIYFENVIHNTLNDLLMSTRQICINWHCTHLSLILLHHQNTYSSFQALDNLRRLKFRRIQLIKSMFYYHSSGLDISVYHILGTFFPLSHAS